jgi:hypothetical protein
VIERAWQHWDVESYKTDPMLHTSDYSRAAARRVIDYLAKEQEDEEGTMTHNSKYEEVTYGSVIITLTQQEYLSGTKDNPYYEASGVDPDGNTHTVRWEEGRNGGPVGTDCEDESEACEWNKYTVDCKHETVEDAYRRSAA